MPARARWHNFAVSLRSFGQFGHGWEGRACSADFSARQGRPRRAGPGGVHRNPPAPLTRRLVQRDLQRPSRLGSKILRKIWQLDGEA